MKGFSVFRGDNGSGSAADSLCEKQELKIQQSDVVEGEARSCLGFTLTDLTKLNRQCG